MRKIGNLPGNNRKPDGRGGSNCLVVPAPGQASSLHFIELVSLLIELVSLLIELLVSLLIELVSLLIELLVSLLIKLKLEDFFYWATQSSY